MSHIDDENGPEKDAAAYAELAKQVEPFEDFFEKNPDRRWISVERTDDGEPLSVGMAGDGRLLITERRPRDADSYEGDVYWKNEAGELVHFALTPDHEKSARFTQAFKTGTSEQLGAIAEHQEGESGSELAEIVKQAEDYLREHPGQAVEVQYEDGTSGQAIRRSVDIELGDDDRVYIHEGSDDPVDRYWIDESGELVGLKEQPAPGKAAEFAKALESGTSELDPLPPEQEQAAYSELMNLFDETKPSGETRKVIVKNTLSQRAALELHRNDDTGVKFITDLSERAEGKPGIYVIKEGKLFKRDDFLNEEPAPRKAVALAQTMKTGSRVVF